MRTVSMVTFWCSGGLACVCALLLVVAGEGVGDLVDGQSWLIVPGGLG
jgi:hypothetical protein